MNIPSDHHVHGNVRWDIHGDPTGFFPVVIYWKIWLGIWPGDMAEYTCYQIKQVSNICLSENYELPQKMPFDGENDLNQKLQGSWDNPSPPGVNLVQLRIWAVATANTLWNRFWTWTAAKILGDIKPTRITGWWFGIFFMFPYIGNNHPNWLIFFRGVQTTNQINIQV